MLRPYLAEHDVTVGDGERATAPVAGRAGHRARRIRADAKAGAVEFADRSAPRSNGVNLKHRGADTHAGDHFLGASLIDAGEVGTVGSGAANVEDDDSVEAGLGRRPRHADTTAGRAGAVRVLARQY